MTVELEVAAFLLTRHILTSRAVGALQRMGLTVAARQIEAGGVWPSLPEARRMQLRVALDETVVALPPQPLRLLRAAPEPPAEPLVRRINGRRRHVTFGTSRCAACGARRTVRWEPRWCA